MNSTVQTTKDKQKEIAVSTNNKQI